MKIDVAALREEYSGADLDIDSAASSPFDQFRKWFEEAVSGDLLEPNAMVLSTRGEEFPDQRTVLMKAYDDQGLVFYTNYKSSKAQQIEQHPNVSVLFPWYGLQRQVKIQGIASKISTAESFNYFTSRPYGSQLGAWVSHQSQVISSRSILEMKLAEMKEKFKSGKVPLHDFWGGYRVEPEAFEFWQGRPNRLHDRLLYEKEGTSWNIKRLSP